MRTWITSDWHLGEDRWKIMQRPGFESPQQMVDLLIQNHNSKVAPDDLVIVVGDVVYQKADRRFLEEIANFNGKKILIRGNHDKVFTDEDFAPYFDQIIAEGDGMELMIGSNEFWLTHYPSCARADQFNLVGHVHGAWKFQLNMMNIGIDANHYFPHELDDMAFYVEAVTKFYDADIWAAYMEQNANYQGKRGQSTSYFKKAV